MKNQFHPLADDNTRYPEPDVAETDIANRPDDDPSANSIEPDAPKDGARPKAGVRDYGGKIAPR